MLSCEIYEGFTKNVFYRIPPVAACIFSLVNRSRRLKVFCKKGILKTFAKFTGKHLRPATLTKKKFWCRCFLENFENTPDGCFYVKSVNGKKWYQVQVLMGFNHSIKLSQNSNLLYISNRILTDCNRSSNLNSFYHSHELNNLTFPLNAEFVNLRILL